MDQQAARVGVHVGPWVLGLSSGQQDVGDDLVELVDQLDQALAGDVLEGELALACVARISLSQDGVAVTRDDTARGEDLTAVLGELLVGDVTVAQLVLEILQELQDFLVGKSVERSSETIHTSGIGEVRIREGRSNKVSSVSTKPELVMADTTTRENNSKVVHVSKISRLKKKKDIHLTLPPSWSAWMTK